MQRFAQIGLYFFFSSELSYSPASPQVTASRVFHVHSSDRQKPLAEPVFIGENIGVCLSQDSPHQPGKEARIGRLNAVIGEMELGKPCVRLIDRTTVPGRSHQEDPIGYSWRPRKVFSLQ